WAFTGDAGGGNGRVRPDAQGEEGRRSRPLVKLLFAFAGWRRGAWRAGVRSIGQGRGQTSGGPGRGSRDTPHDCDAAGHSDIHDRPARTGGTALRGRGAGDAVVFLARPKCPCIVPSLPLRSTSILQPAPPANVSSCGEIDHVAPGSLSQVPGHLE